jgi:hypothetical protein
MQGTPAGLPFGMPGIGLEIEGAVQQAAQRGRHSMVGRSCHTDRLPDLPRPVRCST